MLIFTFKARPRVHLPTHYWPCVYSSHWQSILLMWAKYGQLEVRICDLEAIASVAQDIHLSSPWLDQPVVPEKELVHQRWPDQFYHTCQTHFSLVSWGLGTKLSITSAGLQKPWSTTLLHFSWVDFDDPSSTPGAARKWSITNTTAGSLRSGIPD